MEPVSLGDLVSDALAAAQPVATAKGVQLHGRMDGPVELDGSARELSRVLGNLLDNALRETPPGARSASRRAEGTAGPSSRSPTSVAASPGLPSRAYWSPAPASASRSPARSSRPTTATSASRTTARLPLRGQPPNRGDTPRPPGRRAMSRRIEMPISSQPATTSTAA